MFERVTASQTTTQRQALKLNLKQNASLLSPVTATPFGLPGVESDAELPMQESEIIKFVNKTLNSLNQARHAKEVKFSSENSQTEAAGTCFPFAKLCQTQSSASS